jgi:hypothetical protein
MAMKKTLDDLCAEAAIRDLQNMYCRAFDRVDMELLRSCFHPDATFDFGFYSGGVDGFIEMSVAGMPLYTSTTHATSNQLVEVRGNQVWAEHYAVTTLRLPADDQGPAREMVSNVRYVDRAECRDGDWRIAHRILLMDSNAVVSAMHAAPVPPVRQSSRDRDDPSYDRPVGW